jgi:hypothetical protein
VEVDAILRRASAAGDFATVIRKGDDDRGTLVILISSRGNHFACLERVLDFASGDYAWAVTGPAKSAESAEVARFVAGRARLDPDLWVIELHIADPERFIAETTAAG